MKMKKYEVTDMKEALKLIKQDLGSDAVILSTRKIMKSNNFGLFARPVLEVTAAVDYKTPSPKNQPAVDNGYASYAAAAYAPKKRAERRPQPAPVGPASSPYEPEPAKKKVPSAYSEPAYYDNAVPPYRDDDYAEFSFAPRPYGSAAETASRSFQPVSANVGGTIPDDGSEKIASIISSLGLDKFSGLLNDIGDIKKQLAEMKSGFSGSMVIDLPSRLKDYHTLFIKNGVDDVISYKFLKNLEKRIGEGFSNLQIKSSALELLSEIILTEPDYCSVMKKRIVALAGPTGVGKTTTIAKIAANLALKYNQRVCLVTVDNFRIGAVEQLKTYAEIVNLPLYVATSPEELRRVINEVRPRYDCVLLDSMGRSQFDAKQIKSINSFFEVDHGISVALVLSLAANHAELYDTLERYSALSPEYLIFTKLDETRYFGPLINLPLKKKIPLLLVTTGQNVPDDMEIPDGKKIAKRVLQEIPSLWSDK